MSSMVLSYLEIIVILSTAAVLGIMLLEMKKSGRKLYAAVSVVIFIFGFVICVIMSGLEKERYTVSMIIIGIIVIYAILVIALFIIMFSKKDDSPGRDVIVEAFDKINTGVCYFDSHGRIILCNEYMHRIFQNGWGKRVLDGSEFLNAILSSSNKSDSENTYELQIKDKYYSVHVGETVVGNDNLTEIIVVDTTDLNEKKKELELNNQKLLEVNRHLTEYGDIADTVIREQEILNAKIQVHDRFGDLLLTTKRAIEDKLPDDEVSRILDSIKDTLTFMKFGKEELEEDSFKELEKTADGIGVKIHLTGMIPEEKEKRAIVLLGMKESLTNTVKHARGHNLYVDISDGDKMCVIITNDGDKPNGIITLGTGLTALKSKVDRAGGVMRVSTENGFILYISV